MLAHSQEIIILIIIFIFLAFLTVAGLVVYFIFGIQNRNFVHLKQIEGVKSQKESEILQSQIEIQEQTFSNISAEIHDNIGQKLTLTKLSLNTLPIKGNEELEEKVSKITRLIGEAIMDLSDLSRSMSSEIVLQNGLIKAIEFEVGQLMRLGPFQVSFHLIGDPVFLPADTDLVLFRMFQECINNVVKHAGATEISIELHYKPEEVVLSVADNGNGNIPVGNEIKGIGLANMRKRGQLLNADIKIESLPGQGSTITIKIPFHEIKTETEG